jgi:hypothetical protein
MGGVVALFYFFFIKSKRLGVASRYAFFNIVVLFFLLQRPAATGFNAMAAGGRSKISIRNIWGRA